jgi:hypothetical protein
MRGGGTGGRCDRALMRSFAIEIVPIKCEFATNAFALPK